uniref:Na_H_Exchanger domain-containing protein n=1 Tax=Panagrellus redivivus TaxID=6233 RepID=A0A7E4WCB9_PANRE
MPRTSAADNHVHNIRDSVGPTRFDHPFCRLISKTYYYYGAVFLTYLWLFVQVAGAEDVVGCKPKDKTKEPYAAIWHKGFLFAASVLLRIAFFKGLFVKVSVAALVTAVLIGIFRTLFADFSCTDLEELFYYALSTILDGGVVVAVIVAELELENNPEKIIANSIFGLVFYAVLWRKLGKWYFQLGGVIIIAIVFLLLHV